jgi:hypothetical protein
MAFQHRRTREGLAVFCVWEAILAPFARGMGDVTACYKTAEDKGKVLPLFADKLISIEFCPLEEA